MVNFANPYRPGAGHMPPFLAGREQETNEFSKLLDQTVILENLSLTGLRGVGKTVLLESFKPIAIEKSWVWTGGDMSESACINEENMAIRIITDLSVHTSGLIINESTKQQIGFTSDSITTRTTLNYQILKQIFDSTPGLNIDKLKATLEFAWKVISNTGIKGVIFAYDEAQNLADHSDNNQFPLSMILDVFQGKEFSK